jgi:hypothetical protein
MLLPGQVASAAAEVPEFTFSDCPQEVPAAGWRCEVLITDARAKFGKVELDLSRQRLTFAEGQLNGQFAQVFGALRAEPSRVPGGLFGTGDRDRLLHMDVQVQYAGWADFHGNNERMGEINLKLKVISPVLPSTCTIGSDADPVAMVVKALGRPQPVEGHPDVGFTTVEDRRFGMPKAYGCGVFTGLVERRFGGGDNWITMPTFISMKQYDKPHIAEPGNSGDITIGQ